MVPPEADGPVFYRECGAMFRRPRTRSAAAILLGRRCARRLAVAGVGQWS